MGTVVGLINRPDVIFDQNALPHLGGFYRALQRFPQLLLLPCVQTLQSASLDRTVNYSESQQVVLCRLIVCGDTDYNISEQSANTH